jgi:uncharacterized NAD(P)/FAD-binding protein YdhS
MEPKHALSSIRSTIGPIERRARLSVPLAPPRTVVIVGGGFCGTAVALHLLRLPHAAPLRIILVDRALLARGVAYAKRDKSYRLNVPAGRMSASSADPGEFLAHARRRVPDASAADFLPRELYGDYLESTLRSAELASPAHVRLERMQGEVIALEREPRASTIRAWLDSGLTLVADTVVLASGNPAPAPLPGAPHVQRGRYVADPWESPTAYPPGETLLVAGTGLTMADVVLAADDVTGGRVTVHALSRHGLVPVSQEEPREVRDANPDCALAREGPLSLRRLVREVRKLADDLEGRGYDWRAAITAVRNIAPAVWERLSVHERRRFLRHVRPYWDLHRHRLPPQTCAALTELRRQDRLHIHAGRILNLESAGKKVRVTWQARGTSTRASLLVDRVVNCTGPHYDVRHTRERLQRLLLARGMMVPDSLGLGIATDQFGALIDASGRVAENLYYVGPMLRGKYWEATAVQELRVHAEQLARHLALSEQRERNWGYHNLRA